MLQNLNAVIERAEASSVKYQHYTKQNHWQLRCRTYILNLNGEVLRAN